MLRRFAALMLCWFVIGSTPAWAAHVKLGTMGDSLTDEYSQAGYANYGSYNQNWLEQQQIYNGVNPGPFGASWGSPRDSGYEYNWAKSGANSSLALSQGQHTGLAGQVATKGLTHAILFVGNNDFRPDDLGGAYYNIYNNNWSTTQINNHVNTVVGNITTALNAVKATGVKVSLVNLADFGITPATTALYGNATNRARVTAAVQQVNAALEGVAQANQIPLVDMFGLTRSMFGPTTSLKTNLLLGNVNIKLKEADNLWGVPGLNTLKGSRPKAGFISDGIHPATTIQGIMSNTFMASLNIAYGAGVPMFTEQQILAHRGIAYGGSDTLAGTIGPYSNWVHNYYVPPAFAASAAVVVPEPSTVTLMGVGVVGLLASAWRARKKRQAA